MSKASLRRKSASSPVAYARTSPSALTRGQLLDRLGLPENRPAGRLGRRGWKRDRGGKGRHLGGRSLLKVIRDDAHLLIFGDGPHRERLVRFRDQVEIADKVHFLGDRGDFRTKFLPLYGPVLGDGRARRAAGRRYWKRWRPACPWIAADVPGMRDLIEHEKTGYLFAPAIAPASPAA